MSPGIDLRTRLAVGLVVAALLLGGGALADVDGLPALSDAAFTDQTPAGGNSWQSAEAFGDWIAASTGQDHTCAIALDGAGWCWGDNEHGQLGVGDTTQRHEPAAVDTGDMDRPLVAISAGGEHTCAVDDTGAAWCWGSGAEGRLGTGGNAQEITPASVVSTAMSAPVEAIGAGGRHTCALSDDQAWCWGANTGGELGDGNEPNSSSQPVTVDTQEMSGAVSDLSAGDQHTCAVSADEAWCWGQQSNEGRLGNDDSDNADTPVAVVTTSMSGDVATVSAGGRHTCAIEGAGAAWCWGTGWDGRLGQGASANSPTPVAVDASEMSDPVTSITAGGDGAAGHTCAVAGAEAWCWGSGGDGQLGDGDQQGDDAPRQVSTGEMADPVEVAMAGRAHSCALDAHGLGWCWGANQEGQLGIGETSPADEPVRVEP